MSIGRFIVIAAMVLATGMSACGRRGALEPPPGADEAPPAQTQNAKPEEKKSFLLDFLIL